MTTSTSEEPYIELDGECLLSKWGFSDGDVLYDWWWDHYDERPPFNEHDVIYAMVVAYLVPAMTEAGYELDIFRIHTIHNPVRTETVNGVEIDHTDSRRPDMIVPPVSVRVTKTQIEELVGKFVIKEVKKDGPKQLESRSS